MMVVRIQDEDWIGKTYAYALLKISDKLRLMTRDDLGFLYHNHVQSQHTGIEIVLYTY